VQRRIELKPSLSLASNRTAPQWHWPAQTFASPGIAHVSCFERRPAFNMKTGQAATLCRKTGKI